MAKQNKNVHTTPVKKENPHTGEEVNYLGTGGRGKSKENKDRNKKLNLGDGSSGH